MTTDSIISKVWGFCTTLRDDGVGYGDYLEQLSQRPGNNTDHDNRRHHAFRGRAEEGTPLTLGRWSGRK
jgi:hypothetical protein